MSEPMPFSPPPRLGVLIYDGSCDMCTAAIGHRYRFFENHGFAVASLQTPGIPEYAHRDTETLMTAIHLVMSDGRVFVGVDCFLVLFDHILWLRPLAWALRLPFVYSVARGVYAAVAKRRHVKQCPL